MYTQACLTAYAALLARVQAFLPQLEQANLNLPRDGQPGDAFQLIEQQEDEDQDGDSREDDIVVPTLIEQANDSDEEVEDDENEDEPQLDPQIVFVRLRRARYTQWAECVYV